MNFNDMFLHMIQSMYLFINIYVFMNWEVNPYERCRRICCATNCREYMCIYFRERL